MAENARFLPGLSPVGGKPVQVAFDGGRLTSDGGVLVLAEMIRYRALLIAAGYEDANDCDALRADPAFKIAVGLDPAPNVGPSIRGIRCYRIAPAG